MNCRLWIAHEVNQPLTGIVLKGSAALRWLGTDRPNIKKARDLLSKVVHAGHRASDIVASVRAMFKKSNNDKTPVDLNDLVRAVLVVMQIDLAKNRIEFQTQFDEGLPLVEGDKVQLQQVNLVMNAMESMHSLRPRIFEIAI